MLQSQTLFRRVVSTASILVALCAFSVAQVSSETVIIGGNGAFASNNTNPPSLDYGYPASAAIEYIYNQSTKRLTVRVTNTTPVVSGAFSPVITKVFFNLPSFAVTGISLVSQSHANGNLSWNAAFDTNLENGGNLNASYFGRFGVRLKTTSGVNKAIRPAEGCVTNGNTVFGPAEFVFQVSGPGVCSLSASAFANSQSAGQQPVNAAVHFQAGGECGNLSVFMSNAPECSAGGWIYGDPRPGNTLWFVETAAPGCYGCLICSTDPGPTTAFGLTAPVGDPYIVVLSALFPNGTAANVSQVPVVVPDDDAIIGVTYYCAVVIVDEATQTGFDIGEQFTITILPRL